MAISVYGTGGGGADLVGPAGVALAVGGLPPGRVDQRDRRAFQRRPARLAYVTVHRRSLRARSGRDRGQDQVQVAVLAVSATVTLTVAVAVGHGLGSRWPAAASSGPIVVRSFFSLRKKDSTNAAASTGTRARKIGGSA